jgi:hypothetical protein
VGISEDDQPKTADWLWEDPMKLQRRDGGNIIIQPGRHQTG